MNSGNPVPASGRVRKRVAEACAFCRRRKIKCSAERPSCAACVTHSKVCNYEGNRGAAHNRSRQTTTSGPSAHEATGATGATGATRTAGVTEAAGAIGSIVPNEGRRVEGRLEETGAKWPVSVSRIVTTNGMTSYHGRTSTLFDEHVHHDRPAAEVRPKMPEEWIEKGLIAEATRQRHLEDVSFRNGTLDFDGVEPELGMHLLSLHWNRQHHSFLITYRPAFMRDMACNGPYFSKLLLNAIYFGASKFSPRHEVRRVANDVRTAGWQFRKRVRQLLGEALDRSEITTIQALLVMTNSLFALGDERSAAWTYAGIAFRMIVDLGLHVDKLDLAATPGISDEDYEIRRRVFWAAFVVDKIQSLYQGRPVSIKEADTLVPIKFLDTYEELEQWAPFAYTSQPSGTYLGSPAFSVSTFTQLCKLSIILGDILSSIYTERSSIKSPGNLSSKLQNIHQKLTSWLDNLPGHLAFDPKKTIATPPPHVLSLHALYNVLMILLHRPFVTDGHLYNTSRAISVSSFMTCATAADSIVELLRAYDKAFSVRKAPYLISYATYVAATIHARIAAKRGADSQAHGNLLACLGVFRENQETNWAVRRANAVVQNLIKRLGLNVPDLGNARIDSSTTTVYNSTDALAGQPVEQEQSLQSPDIDGILQSFVREQENAQLMRTLPNNRVNSTGMGASAPLPPYYPFSNSSGAYSEQRDAVTMRHDPYTSLQTHQSQPADASVTVDDLLYGLNGSALDSFPFLDWESIRGKSSVLSSINGSYQAAEVMQTDRNSAPTPLSALHRMLLYAEMAILVGLPHMQYMLLVCALNKMLRTLGRAFTTETLSYLKLGNFTNLTTLPMSSELPAVPARSTRRVRCSLPATLMRAGTSKGLFIHRHHLPASESLWAGPLLAAMGSQNSDARQIDGIGGATSTTSKVAVVAPSTRPGIDVDYTFVQVAVGKDAVDLTGNCGNMCAGVGPFAIQEGLVHAQPGERSVDVRIFNTNTSRVIIDTVEINDDGSVNEDGDYAIPGVRGTGSEIKVSFVDPAGSMTGKLFPTGRRTDTIISTTPTSSSADSSNFSVLATLIDAANPFVVVDASTLPLHLRTCAIDSKEYLETMESIRRTGAVMMGLASSTEAAAKVRGTPKLALVSPASAETPSTSPSYQPSKNCDSTNGLSEVAAIQVLAFSMGMPHPSLQLTGAACLAAAVCIEGTVAHRAALMRMPHPDPYLCGLITPAMTPERSPSPGSASLRSEDSVGSEDSTHPLSLHPEQRTVRISHQSGSIEVGVVAASSEAFAVVERCTVSRTARRLFEGTVWYYQ